MTELELKRRSGLSGTIRPPGSKSIANRAILLSMIAEGSTRIEGLPDSDDVCVLLDNLPALGVKADRREDSVMIEGAAGPLPVKEGYFQLENAGTALRPVIAILSTGSGHYTVDGNAQMRKRPVKALVNAIQSLGVDITCSDTGCPPVAIRSNGWQKDLVQVSAHTSSQFVSALLIAASVCGREITLELRDDPVSKPYIDITMEMLHIFGVSASKDKSYRYYRIDGRMPPVSPEVFKTEADASAATYFLAAGAIPGNGPVEVTGVGSSSIQGDSKFIQVLKQMGADVEAKPGSMRVKPSSMLSGVDIDMNDMPDAAMTLAVLALFAKGDTRIYNIENLRVKESERIRGLRIELEKLGAIVVETKDSLLITPPETIRPAVIETYQDHRMAMAFSLASLGTDVKILDPDCVRKTYPDYFQDFQKLSA